MNRDKLLEKLTALIEPYVQDKDLLKGIDESTDLLADLKVNSAHLVDIILDAEEHFDIEIDDESAEKMLTVGAAIEIIESKLGEQ